MKEKIKINKRAASTKAVDYLLIAAGAFICALSVDMFTAPNNIVASGLTGIATMLNYVFGLPIGVCILVMNIPMFIWGAAENGRSFLTKTVTATVLVSIAIDALKPVAVPYTNDVLLAAIFAGILSGIGFALIIYRGGTAGGVDILARNLNNRFPYVSVGSCIFIANSVIILMAGLVYKNIESMLYPVVVIFVSVKIMDSVLYGFAHNNGKLMFIISEHYDEISSEIISRIARGLTLLDSQGGYGKKENKVILCAVRPSQVHKINKIALDIDEAAFIITTTANAINGKGFAEKD